MTTLTPSFLIIYSSFLECNTDMHKCLTEFEILPVPTIDYGVICPWASLGYNQENDVYNFSWLFTYLRIIQTILMTCWLSGERSLPFGLLVW